MLVCTSGHGVGYRVVTRCGGSATLPLSLLLRSWAPQLPGLAAFEAPAMVQTPHYAMFTPKFLHMLACLQR